MLTDVLCVCFGMIISKLIEKPMFAVTVLKYMLKYKNLIITSLKTPVCNHSSNLQEVIKRRQKYKHIVRRFVDFAEL